MLWAADAGFATAVLPVALQRCQQIAAFRFAAWVA